MDDKEARLAANRPHPEPSAQYNERDFFIGFEAPPFVYRAWLRWVLAADEAAMLGAVPWPVAVSIVAAIGSEWRS